jgi:hypothetical protein
MTGRARAGEIAAALEDQAGETAAWAAEAAAAHGPAHPLTAGLDQLARDLHDTARSLRRLAELHLTEGAPPDERTTPGGA